MFDNKDKKELQQQIDQLLQKMHFIQRDILNLQNPFRFQIGDKVIAETKKGVNLLPEFPIKYDGTVVGMKFEYRRKEPYFIHEERVNIYTVFNAASKTTHELSEQWYQIELK